MIDDDHHHYNDDDYNDATDNNAVDASLVKQLDALTVLCLTQITRVKAIDPEEFYVNHCERKRSCRRCMQMK
jgi:hypothetical protein